MNKYEFLDRMLQALREGILTWSNPEHVTEDYVTQMEEFFKNEDLFDVYFYAKCVKKLGYFEYREKTDEEGKKARKVYFEFDPCESFVVDSDVGRGWMEIRLEDAESESKKEDK